MNFRQIEYVLAVSELKSFGRAADKCYITQSTLSTMVARMEESLGVTIFNRKTKPISITQEGERIIQQLKVIQKEIESLDEITKSLKGELSGTLKLGIIPTVAPYLLPLFLNDFIQQLPDVHFEISEITTDKIIEKLRTRELDIGILSTPLHQADMVEIDLFQEPFMLYDKSGTHLTNDHFKISEIDYSRLWLLEEGHCMRTQAEHICGLHERHARLRNIDYKSGSIDTLIKYIRRNDGITLLPYLATLDLPTSERIFLKTFEPPVPSRTIGIMVHQHFVKRNLLDMLKDIILQKVTALIDAYQPPLTIVNPV